MSGLLLLCGASRLNESATYPRSQNLWHTLSIIPHGRPAGEQWWGGPGVVFACRTGSETAVRGRAISVPPNSYKNFEPAAGKIAPVERF